ncbi:HsmA family protein [Patescibacteria group bacterium]
MLIIAVVAVSLALVLYSSAIIAERFCDLNGCILAVFGLGLFCDMLGTTLMSFQSKELILNMHTVFGFTALIIMAVHFVWAMKAIRGSESSRMNFKRISPLAWLLWVTAFLSGVP